MLEETDLVHKSFLVTKRDAARVDDLAEATGTRKWSVQARIALGRGLDVIEAERELAAANVA